MAISPKTKGLGNIGSIVNRQGLAAPTRPVAKPMAPAAKPMAKPMAPANRATTTAAQRAANQPFKNYTKPAMSMPKINPMAQAMQPQMPMTPPQPFNPQPGTNQGMLPNVQRPAPQPFNPSPTPGQDFGGQMGEPTVPGYMLPDVMPQGYTEFGNMFGGMGNMFGGMGNMFGNLNQLAQQNPNAQFQMMDMFGTGQQNPTTPENDEYRPLDNTNPSGSLFSGGGFAGPTTPY